MSVIKKDPNSSVRKLAIGTIGHVDHGKTSLTAAITMVANKISGIGDIKKYDEIDNAPEEKARGITISTAHVCYHHKDVMIMHTDCPGHADYIKNMIVGASQMEGCILVIAATDGVMPQTQEHLKLAKLNVPTKNLVVFINKADIAGEELCELVAEEVREYVKEAGFDDDTPIIFGSALCALEGGDESRKALGENKIEELLDVIVDRFESKITDEDRDSKFLMPIEDVFSISGRGTVVTGRVERGNRDCSDGKPLEFKLFNFKTKDPIPVTVTAFQMFHKDVLRVDAGDNVGALLRGIKKDEVGRGMLLCGVDTDIKTARKIKVELYVFKKEEGGRATAIHSGYRPQMYLKTADVTVTVNFVDDTKEFIMPGDNDTVILEFINNLYIPVEIGWRVALREGGKTIAVGVIAENIE